MAINSCLGTEITHLTVQGLMFKEWFGMVIEYLSSDTDIKHFFFCEQHFGTINWHPHLAILPAILLGVDAPLYGFEIL